MQGLFAREVEPVNAAAWWIKPRYLMCHQRGKKLAEVGKPIFQLLHIIYPPIWQVVDRILYCTQLTDKDADLVLIPTLAQCLTNTRERGVKQTSMSREPNCLASQIVVTNYFAALICHHHKGLFRCRFPQINRFVNGQRTNLK
jgi:hypothetical protein